MSPIKQRREQFVTTKKPVSNQSNPIITGYFPQKTMTYKEMAISKVNRILCGLLVVSLFITAFAYYFVTISEMKLSTMTRETMALNSENADLQIKLDRMESYYNIDRTVRKSNLLHKAQQVIEVPAASVPPINVNKGQDKFKFKWSMGF